MSPGKPAIQAAGVVLLRTVHGRQQVLLVHRPHHKDWSLPKGKLHAGESHFLAALRECQEETGIDPILGPPLGKQRYRIMGRAKTVSYWSARTGRVRNFQPNKEVDKIAWVDVSAVGKVLTYRRDLRFIGSAANLPKTSPLIVVRHAAAEKRSDFSGPDNSRPLSSKGFQQAKALAGLLAGYGIARLESSNATRCVQTLKPFSAESGVEIRADVRLSEAGFAQHPHKTRKQMQRLITKRKALIVCSHRPVLPALLNEIGALPSARTGVWKQALHPASVVVIHRDTHQRNKVIATERHESA
jgi:phosphohistidine phosphatase SixA/8-oxo-dGTP pyrophosphatase MutT (NUDIX family)